ncbi:uracil-DNA glycosylase family protein [Shewanella sp. NIFS-20-20]|uniref:uracil-DNA glycosylase family protein n=1 Tax=Shewanella sp. NIFS-20-20 TaxID=2853806 RepID=UPI001C496AE6|nr:uracil-DNA glycosylase family protein [Shewanella sp. NIFS-20-20]MBV7316574.1 uracil-DNA glycosylase family protein [Shewanella sp. NIFS-20-20]
MSADKSRAASKPLTHLLDEIRQCSQCQSHLPLPARPILQASGQAKILIAGQAPGRVTHQRSIPFDDASGDRLRRWLGVSRASFYDPNLFAIVPMGFCYPGTLINHGKKHGDCPPRPECQQRWHPQLLPLLDKVELTIILGQFAIDYHLGRTPKLSVTQAVSQWQRWWPRHIVLPHPSPRNNLWLKRHPDFEHLVIPSLQSRVRHLLTG